MHPVCANILQNVDGRARACDRLLSLRVQRRALYVLARDSESVVVERVGCYNVVGFLFQPAPATAVHCFPARL